MSIPRALSQFITRLMVGVLWFAQIAVAAYACSGAAGMAMAGATGADAKMARASTAGVDSGNTTHGAMDPAQPNLCAAHCQSGQQNSGAKAVPDLPMAAPASLCPLVSATVPVRTQCPVGAAEDPPPMADPPHAILHCCFRI